MKTYQVKAVWAQDAHINQEQYQQMYQQSIDDPARFWALQAERYISWFKPWEQVLQGDFKTHDVAWFTGAELNACYNCVDRHLPTHADHVALIWEGNDIDQNCTLTYAELHQKVCQLANVLKSKGVRKGDRVCLYLPMIMEVVIAMLACARIGAIHSVVFGGFSPDALKTRILDAECTVLITADESVRGEKRIPLKQQSDEALLACPDVRCVIVIKHTGGLVPWNETRDAWYHEMMACASRDCPVESMRASDPLFILYTSGSTGKPKGVVHGIAGYLVYAAFTFHTIFDYRAQDVFWCTADVGWITGHSYLVYGPLLNGATTLLFEGVPNHPTHARFWDIIDKHQVTIFYTAPTALRALRREGDAWVKASHRSSLRILGSVGEPINPEVWKWYFDVVGEQRCPIVNTWWQTETGGILLSAFPGATPLVPGAAGWPFFGIIPEIVDEQGQPVLGNKKSGLLVIKRPWPGMMQTIFGDKQRFIDSYLNVVPECYFTGDGAYRDEAGHLWITGRNDDVIKVSGHRMGTEELESAFVSHPAVSEAAVVGIPHDIKGECIVAFVTLKADIIPTHQLNKALIQYIRDKIGPFAAPEWIQWSPALPKTRSGKIMRRILRKIANNEFGDIGDISTLADPSVVNHLIDDRLTDAQGTS